jgi:tetratricopeptide (TPR) repeat protein
VIETNLGAIAFALGRQAGGAARFEAAYAIRRDDPNAVANLALARIIQDRCEEAMELARQALEATPRAEHAVKYLLSAAARSIWQGEPETLIPPDLVGSSHADLGFPSIRIVAEEMFVAAGFEVESVQRADHALDIARPNR